MAILGRRGSSMGRVRRQAVAAGSPVQQRADVRAMAASTPKGSPVSPDVQTAMMRQFNKSPQAARQATPAEVAALNKRSPNVASYNEGVAKAFQQFNAQPKTPVAQRTGIAPAASQ